MKRKLLLVLNSFLMLLVTSSMLNAQLKVSGKKLLDPCGNQVLVRGIEQVVGTNFTVVNEMLKTNANAVRLLPMFTGHPETFTTAAQLDAMLALGKNKGVIMYITPILTFDGGDLFELAIKWFERDDIRTVLMKYKDYTILDGIAELNTRDFNFWETKAKEAVRRLRAEGYTQPINCMASWYGRSPYCIIRKGPAVFNSDPLKNVMFNVQAYWNTCQAGWCANENEYGAQGTSTQIIQQNLAKFGDPSFPYVVTIGAVNWADGNECNAGYVDYKAIMDECKKHQLGWLNWSWITSGDWSHAYDITTDGIYGHWRDYSVVTDPPVDPCRTNTPYGKDYGNQVVLAHPNGLRTAQKTAFYSSATPTCSGNPATYTLTVTASNGTVGKNPNLTSYPSGSTVTLTARPNSGYRFAGWLGDAGTAANPITITMNTNKNIMANFVSLSDPTPTTTITFENLAAGRIGSNPYQDPSGYSFTGIDPVGQPEALNVVTNHSTKSIVPNNFQGKVRIQRTGGGSFNLVRFDYHGDPWDATADATVTGTYAAGGTVTSSYTGGANFATLTLNWTGLSRVEINFQGGATQNYGLIDNVVVSSSLGARESIPETGAENGNGVDVSVYPNPVNSNTLTVQLYSDRVGKAKVTMQTAAAQEGISVERSLSKGLNSFDVPTDNLKNGLHLLIINKGHERVVKKIMINR